LSGQRLVGAQSAQEATAMLDATVTQANDVSVQYEHR
jgi:hypothetical protein